MQSEWQLDADSSPKYRNLTGDIPHPDGEIALCKTLSLFRSPRRLTYSHLQIGSTFKAKKKVRWTNSTGSAQAYPEQLSLWGS